MKLVQWIDQFKERRIYVVGVFVFGVISTVVYLSDLGQRFLAWVNPPPVRAALTDFSTQGGQINAALTVEAEALTGSYAWVCTSHGANNVHVLPIARSTALRFSISAGFPETHVYLLLAQGDLLEIAVDLYSGAASDAVIIAEGDQKCG